MNAAQRIREAREVAGLSRERLARLADVSTSTVYTVERGLVPSTEVGERLARALGLDPATLWGEA